MEPQCYVLLPVEEAEGDCRLVVTGCLTATNQQWLYPLVRKTRVARLHGRLIVDLTHAHVMGPAADLLRWDLDHDDATGIAPVHVLEPHPDHTP